MAATRHAYINFYMSDWATGTARMTRLQRSLYFDVCFYNWDRVAPMPRAEQAFQFADVADADAQIEILIAAGKMRRTQGGGLVNDRALNAGRTASERWSNAKAAGKASAAKRWGDKDNSGNGGYNGGYAEPEPEPEPDIPPTPQGGECDLFDDEPPNGGSPEGEKYTIEFEIWWAQYPNRTGKRKAAASYAAAVKRLDPGKIARPKTHHLLLHRLVAQCRVWKRKGIEGRYIPHPTTWLNQGRYDDPEVVTAWTKLNEPPPDPGPEPELSPAKPKAKERPKLAPVGWTPDEDR